MPPVDFGRRHFAHHRKRTAKILGKIEVKKSREKPWFQWWVLLSVLLLLLLVVNAIGKSSRMEVFFIVVSGRPDLKCIADQQETTTGGHNEILLHNH